MAPGGQGQDRADSVRAESDSAFEDVEGEDTGTELGARIGLVGAGGGDGAVLVTAATADDELSVAQGHLAVAQD